MPISSMTGFARADGRHGPFSWNWEVKSVNGRGLDVRCRMPSGFDGLEPDLRRRLGDTFARGNFQISLHLMRQSGQTELRVNQAALQQVLSALKSLPDDLGLAPARADGILGIKGVLELSDIEETDDERAARDAALLESFENTLGDLVAARQAEGEKLKVVVSSAIDQIDELAVKASNNASTQPETLRKQLKLQIDDVLQDTKGVSEERLSQEVAILLTKGDIREEIDRLKAHAVAAKDLLKEDGPVGRRLDFLMQEFNREANTLCSKSADVELTQIGLDLKTVIDQVREQVQNIE